MHGSGTCSALLHWGRKRTPDRSNDKHAKDDICRPTGRWESAVPSVTHIVLCSHISVFASRTYAQLETCHTPRPLHAPARHWRGCGQDTHKTLRVVVGKKGSARSGDRELSCARHSGKRHTTSTRSVTGVCVRVMMRGVIFTQVNRFMRT